MCTRSFLQAQNLADDWVRPTAFKPCSHCSITQRYSDSLFQVASHSIVNMAMTCEQPETFTETFANANHWETLAELRSRNILVDLQINVSHLSLCSTSLFFFFFFFSIILVSSQVARGRVVRAHSIVLAARFECLQELLKVKKERLTSIGLGLIKGFPVPIRCLNILPILRTVESMIGYAYTSEITLDWTSAQKIYLLALNIGCDRVNKYCVNYLKTR